MCSFTVGGEVDTVIRKLIARDVERKTQSRKLVHIHVYLVAMAWWWRE